MALLRNPQQQKEWSIENKNNVQGKKNFVFELGWEIPNWFENDKREWNITRLVVENKEKEDGPKIKLRQWQNIWRIHQWFEQGENKKKKNIEEDKYIYYGTKHAKSEASDPNEIEKTCLMM